MSTSEERIACLEANVKTIFHQLDEMKLDTKAIHELAASVKLLATEMLRTRQKVEQVDDRLYKVEQQPLETYKHYKSLAVGCIITSVVGAICAFVMAFVFGAAK